MNDETRKTQNDLIDFTEAKTGWEVIETTAEEREDIDDNKILRVEIVTEREIGKEDCDYKHDEDEVLE